MTSPFLIPPRKIDLPPRTNLGENARESEQKCPNCVRPESQKYPNQNKQRPTTCPPLFQGGELGPPTLVGPGGGPGGKAPGCECGIPPRAALKAKNYPKPQRPTTEKMVNPMVLEGWTPLTRSKAGIPHTVRGDKKLLFFLHSV